MNAVAEIVPATGGELIVAGNFTPLAVVSDQKVYSEFYDKLRQMVDEFEPDLTTEKGRKAVASLAHKIARSKTAIDDAGKKLTEDARATIKAVDENRREIREQLDELKAVARKPLTDWEAAEEARQEKAREELLRIREAGRVDFTDDAAAVHERIAELEALTIDPALHGDLVGIANAAKVDALEALQAASVRLAREEQERAELERLRAEKIERDRIEAERAAEAEAQRQREEAEKAEQERQEREAREAEARAKAEQERIEQAQREAEERARAEAEQRAEEERQAAARAAQAERLATERAHAEALAAERARAEEAERTAQAERDRIAEQERQRQAAAEQEAAALRAREADRAHRGKVMGEAKEAIIEAGADEAIAKAIVLAIAAGNVPHVSIGF